MANGTTEPQQTEVSKALAPCGERSELRNTHLPSKARHLLGKRNPAGRGAKQRRRAAYWWPRLRTSPRAVRGCEGGPGLGDGGNKAPLPKKRPQKRSPKNVPRKSA
jgi:hypothetical protein